jgi:uncharacterized protein (TIGR01777 family)
MTIIVAGGTGFLGQALAKHLRACGHSVKLLTRATRPGRADHVEWRPDGGVGAWAHALDGVDAVVNLAGAGIADARWTAARKATLKESRLLSTRSLVAAMRHAEQRPAVLVNASGVGYYGDRGGELVTEATPPGHDFLAQLCVEWEREAENATDITRVAILRNGLVLHPSGGALAKMLLPFRLGLGGTLGSGTQYVPWIHLDDWLDLVTLVITTSEAHGAFNLTAPNPVTNAEFTRALGSVLNRPTILPVPSLGLRVALGELADTLLTGQRAIPARAQENGFTFGFPDIEPALRSLLQ